jgi:hypothetical protein
MQFSHGRQAGRELFIPDAEARARALWFDAETPDFCIVLQYEDVGAGRRPTRHDFARRLSPVVGVIRDRYDP